MVAVDAPTNVPVAAERLRAVLDGRWAAARDEARELMREHPLPPVHELSVAEYREEINRQARMIAQRGRPGRLYPKGAGGDEDTGGAVTSFEMLGMSDLSLLVK